MTQTNPFALDANPIETDQTDVLLMIQDILMHQKQGLKLLAADDPGVHYSPPRVPRFGFVAYRDAAMKDDDLVKQWTIKLSTFKLWMSDTEAVAPATAEMARVLWEHLRKTTRMHPSDEADTTQP